ncbi:E3 ubiquitin-protein ligase, partial [Tetrabaena socialis]
GHALDSAYHSAAHARTGSKDSLETVQQSPTYPHGAKPVWPSAAALGNIARTAFRSSPAPGFMQLLGVLRAFPRRTGTGDQDSIPGASASTIASIPSFTCQASSPLVGQNCCICLGTFADGDQLKSIQCIHYHHSACLDEWLRIKACCPLCKAVLHDSA